MSVQPVLRPGGPDPSHRASLTRPSPPVEFNFFKISGKEMEKAVSAKRASRNLCPDSLHGALDKRLQCCIRILKRLGHLGRVLPLKNLLDSLVHLNHLLDMGFQLFGVPFLARCCLD